jgi:hypothetical protein
MKKENGTERKTGKEMRNSNTQYRKFRKLSCLTEPCSIFVLYQHFGANCCLPLEDPTQLSEHTVS